MDKIVTFVLFIQRKQTIDLTDDQYAFTETRDSIRDPLPATVFVRPSPKVVQTVT